MWFSQHYHITPALIAELALSTSLVASFSRLPAPIFFLARKFTRICRLGYSFRAYHPWDSVSWFHHFVLQRGNRTLRLCKLDSNWYSVVAKITDWHQSRGWNLFWWCVQPLAFRRDALQTIWNLQSPTYCNLQPADFYNLPNSLLQQFLGKTNKMKRGFYKRAQDIDYFGS